MAQNATVAIPATTWTQVTNGDITAATFQNVGNVDVYLLGTAGASAPVTTVPTGAIKYPPGTGEKAAAIADLFPGVSSANRIYAFAYDKTSVMISHA